MKKTISLILFFAFLITSPQDSFANIFDDISKAVTGRVPESEGEDLIYSRPSDTFFPRDESKPVSTPAPTSSQQETPPPSAASSSNDENNLNITNAEINFLLESSGSFDADNKLTSFIYVMENQQKINGTDAEFQEAYPYYLAALARFLQKGSLKPNTPEAANFISINRKIALRLFKDDELESSGGTYTQKKLDDSLFYQKIKPHLIAALNILVDEQSTDFKEIAEALIKMTVRWFIGVTMGEAVMTANRMGNLNADILRQEMFGSKSLNTENTPEDMISANDVNLLLDLYDNFLSDEVNKTPFYNVLKEAKSNNSALMISFIPAPETNFPTHINKLHDITNHLASLKPEGAAPILLRISAYFMMHPNVANTDKGRLERIYLKALTVILSAPLGNAQLSDDGLTIWLALNTYLAILHDVKQANPRLMDDKTNNAIYDTLTLLTYIFNHKSIPNEKLAEEYQVKLKSLKKLINSLNEMLGERFVDKNTEMLILRAIVGPIIYPTNPAFFALPHQLVSRVNNFEILMLKDALNDSDTKDFLTEHNKKFLVQILNNTPLIQRIKVWEGAPTSFIDLSVADNAGHFTNLVLMFIEMFNTIASDESTIPVPFLGKTINLKPFELIGSLYTQKILQHFFKGLIEATTDGRLKISDNTHQSRVKAAYLKLVNAVLKARYGINNPDSAMRSEMEADFDNILLNIGEFIGDGLIMNEPPIAENEAEEFAKELKATHFPQAEELPLPAETDEERQLREAREREARTRAKEEAKKEKELPSTPQLPERPAKTLENSSSALKAVLSNRPAGQGQDDPDVTRIMGQYMEAYLKNNEPLQKIGSFMGALRKALKDYWPNYRFDWLLSTSRYKDTQEAAQHCLDQYNDYPDFKATLDTKWGYNSTVMITERDARGNPKHYCSMMFSSYIGGE